MYRELFSRSLDRKIKSDGVLVFPPEHQHEAHIIIPDDIVRFCVVYFRLLASQVIDPLCGLGTIPRVIKEQGGKCLGVELDGNRYATAASLAGADVIAHGDFLTNSLPLHSFDCIFTSLPFVWFKDEEALSNLTSTYAERFKELLKSTGIVLLDSVPEVDREGSQWLVAEKQCEYLEKNGFDLKEILTFDNAQHVDATNLSVIMRFEVRK